ncbi:hypothetical protein [Brevundimonas sp.]|uniref:hypothetical protein n=1 Tax=Brevundimonas sp. TaxID=1871086 RepID=UPI0035AE1FC8
MPQPPARRRPGPKPRPVVDYPESLWDPVDEPSGFADALDFHIARHGETVWALHRAVRARGGLIDRTTLVSWRRGEKLPSTPATLKAVALIEDRYRLAPNSLASKVARSHAVQRPAITGIARSEQRRLAWHLPDDFHGRSPAEQAEIIHWVRSNILTGGTAFSRFHIEVSKHRFAFRFDLGKGGRRPSGMAPPPQLAEEMAALIAFKSATLAPVGYRRSGVWGSETAAQRAEHLGLLFGALAAPQDGPVRGMGLRPKDLTLAMLAVPAVWDWYVRWREARRGFYTGWEVDMILLGVAFTRRETGWLRQSPQLAERLVAAPGLIDAGDIETIRSDWDAACERMHSHGLARAKEIQRVARVHRDPFEPLLPVLEAASPVAEYRKITDEILRRMPDARRAPRAAAEASRGFLMLRLGLHTGLRQKNLRQLLYRERGEPARTERELETLKRGELRWNAREGGWEVFIPCAAFKNADSAYFARRPFRLLLPDLGELYVVLERYLDRERTLLLGGATDPGVLFVKTVKRTSADAAYNQTTFYEAWRLAIQRYGIRNPYTGKGAIEGLLPHGPRSVRDVLATHVLKQTGSYEQASYAIQDTAATVAAHYGRFLPQDKAALAASILNRVWEADEAAA